ncbi:MAG: GNAT family N-acetyltransferase [Candidatus Omnitrophica bacterium]|nr:GNAT family N-acetyltransferase [Candidatus Omnitrophota bacterium]
MEVRMYKPEDSVAVKDLILSILEKEYPFDRSAYQDSDINDISGTYSGRDSVFFVIEENGKVIGTIGVKKDAPESALMRRFFVDTNYRKKGLGSMLLEKAVEFCKSKKYKEISFRATDRMGEAMKLCKKKGFEEKDDLEVSGFHIHRFVLKI